MKIIGIVSEYNPFHKGHKYQIDKSLELTNADGVIAIMSGNFVQRGLPAFLDKWTRAEMALQSGVNLVLELPTFYATASAEDFAKGAISLLNATGVVTHLSFGSEVDSLDEITKIATLLANEPMAYKNLLKNQLQIGHSFAKARNIAINQHMGTDINLNQPNMILGIEYLKHLIRLNSKISPLLIKRVGSAYHDTNLYHDISSASAIREKYFDPTVDFNFKNHLPPQAVKVIENTPYMPVNIETFENQIFSLLRRLTPIELRQYREVTEGLENKIVNVINQTTTYSDLINALKSKRYAETKINRMLLNIFLGIKPFDCNLEKFGYLRLLGMDSIGQKIVKNMKSSASLPIITNLNRMEKSLKTNPLIELDVRASNLYALGQNSQTLKRGGRDYLEQIIRV